MASDAELIREKEAARLLSVSGATLRRWRCIGQGPHFYRIGRSVRYRKQDVEQFLAGRVVSPTQPPREKGGLND